ncbi:uncharacterized protein LOC142784008 [Rhipicephalus microplus]|uniref:uncharacterized protein LOC142784008 n=1 Tax=Rhipicephalus microplus TaxID=6941 RepID=UPI003F6D6F42
MSLLLGDRPMVQARDYGVDTAAEDENIVLLCDGSEEEGDACDDLETSATSTPSQGEPNTSGTQRGNLTPDQEKQNTIRFEMKNQLLQRELENMKELLAGVTNSFLQGTQALMGQFLAYQANLLSGLQGMHTPPPAQMPPFMSYLPGHSRAPRQ